MIHTYPDEQDRVYTPLLGNGSALTGASLQNHWDVAHQRVLKWRRESARAGKPWVVANDEQGDAALGVPPDPGFEGFSGRARRRGSRVRPSRVRRYTLWGTLMAGGAGVEYYFGYSLPQSDLACEDWRSRERSWDFARVALDCFRGERIPFHEMEPADRLVGNAAEDNRRYAFAKRGEVYLVYLPKGGSADLDLSGAAGRFTRRVARPAQGRPAPERLGARGRGRRERRVARCPSRGRPATTGWRSCAYEGRHRGHSASATQVPGRRQGPARTGVTLELRADLERLEAGHQLRGVGGACGPTARAKTDEFGPVWSPDGGSCLNLSRSADGKWRGLWSEDPRRRRRAGLSGWHSPVRARQPSVIGTCGSSAWGRDPPPVDSREVRLVPWRGLDARWRRDPLHDGLGRDHRPPGELGE